MREVIKEIEDATIKGIRELAEKVDAPDNAFIWSDGDGGYYLVWEVE